MYAYRSYQISRFLFLDNIEPNVFRERSWIAYRLFYFYCLIMVLSSLYFIFKFVIFLHLTCIRKTNSLIIE